LRINIDASGGRDESLGYYYFYDPVFGPPLDFVGVNIFSPTIQVFATDDIVMRSELLYQNSVEFNAFIFGDIRYTAKENFQIQTSEQTLFTTFDFSMYAKKGMTLECDPNAECVIDGNDFITFQSGNDYPDSKMIIGGSPTTARVDVFTFGSVVLESDNNILVQSESGIVSDFENNVNLYASRGDILFRSISVTDVHNFNVNNYDHEFFDVVFESDENSILLSAGRSIRHLSHWGLGFFNPETQQPRPIGAPNDVAHSLSVDPFPHIYDYFADCDCGGFCSCPDARSKIIEMYQAFLNYGLIRLER